MTGVFGKSENSGSASVFDASEDESDQSSGSEHVDFSKKGGSKELASRVNPARGAQHVSSSSRPSRSQRIVPVARSEGQVFPHGFAPHTFPAPPGWIYIPIPQTPNTPNIYTGFGGAPSGTVPINWRMLQSQMHHHSKEATGTGCQGNEVGAALMISSLNEESAKRSVRRANKQNAE